MSDKSEGEPAHKRSKKEKQSGSPPGEGKADSSPLSRLLVTFLWLLVAFFGPGAVIFLCVTFLDCVLRWAVLFANGVRLLLLTFC